MKTCPLCGAKLKFEEGYSSPYYICPSDVYWDGTKLDDNTAHYWRDDQVESYIARPYYVLTNFQAGTSIISYWGGLDLLLETPALTPMDEERMRDKIKLLLTFS